MPNRVEVNPTALDLARLKAENKSMRRQITRLRAIIHDLETSVKNSGKKGFTQPSAPASPTVAVFCRGECETPRIKSVKTGYKNIYKCMNCGTLWLEEANGS